MASQDSLMAARGAADRASPNEDGDTQVAAGNGLMARLGRLLERDRLADTEITPLFEARATDVRANKLAAAWGVAYTAADGARRRTLLTALARAHGKYTPGNDEATRLFKRLNAQADGLRFLVALRADMLRWRKQVSGLQGLEQTLEGLLSAWFDVGLLELRPLTWDSPASLLEKLIKYEAVHAIKSWDDLRHRVAADRRCYAYFHPQMPDVPLIFVEIAFDARMSDSVQSLLDMQSPSQDLSRARWAIFYSISNTQEGLRGISFGNFLLKRVIERLLQELPQLKSFATLSPIPGFTAWLSKLSGAEVEAIVRGGEKASKAAPDGLRWVERLRRGARGKASEVLRRTGFKLAAHYLQGLKNAQPLDPVARFHLGNGARLERLNWAADVSDKGLEQSCGLMVNYLYVLDDLDDNLARLQDGKIPASRGFGRTA